MGKDDPSKGSQASLDSDKASLDSEKASLDSELGLCHTAYLGLKEDCMVGKETADCTAGTWTFSSGADLIGEKSSHTQCLTNYPLVSWGDATCDKFEKDGETTYVLACPLCFANTSTCAHWGVWVGSLAGLCLFLFCCC